ncbi:MAG: transporter, major facilitator family protein [Eubacterium sp.]|nr:transporter, major facilitator family protein [Eubacterium sp.]
MKLNYKQTFLIGFGFFASSIAWAMYNNYVPVLLGKYLTSTTLIGIVMTFDNIFGVIFQPLFGTLSDKTRTRFGRRMPYILIGIPICAVAFPFIPFTGSLFSLMAVVIIFNFVMSTWRAPVVALMPDLTPAPLRSQANGIINFMGGLGSLFSFLAGGLLFKAGGMPLPFAASAALMLLSVIVLKVFVREQVNVQLHDNEPAGEELKADILPEEPETDASKYKANPAARKVSLIFLLLAILFWFTGYNAVETFFSLYVTNTLKDASGNYLTAGDASLLLAMFSLTFLFFSIPAGFISGRIGRKRTILIGLSGVMILFTLMMFTNNIWALRILLLLGGIFWACVNINSLPMVVEMAQWKDIGRYTGYYYFFSFSAAIISPILFGFIRDMVVRYDAIFIYSAIAFALAIVCMQFVKHGEAKPVKSE